MYVVYVGRVSCVVHVFVVPYSWTLQTVKVQCRLTNLQRSAKVEQAQQEVHRQSSKKLNLVASQSLYTVDTNTPRPSTRVKCNLVVSLSTEKTAVLVAG